MKKPKLFQKIKKLAPCISDIKSMFRTRTFKIGGYSAAATAIVVAIAVFVNVFAGALPSNVTQIDITSKGLYSISGETENILAGLDQDINVYWVVQEGQEDVTLGHLLDRYESLSDRIKVIKKDPDVYPTFLSQYDITETYNNSLIVESEDTFRYISYEDVYEYDYSSYYTSDYSYDTSFAGESVLTSAISYVTSEDLPKMYTLSGHGEGDISSSFSSAIQSANVETEELSLLETGEIPDDADAVMIYAPQNDLSEAEKDIIAGWLDEGGNLILITEPMEEDEFPYLRELMSGYGVTAAEGIVIEGSRNNYLMGTPYYLLPELSGHEITDPLIENGYYVLAPIAQGLETSDNLPEGVAVSALMTTSSAAYSKTAGYSMTTYEKEDGDTDGPFDLAVAITAGTDEENESRIVWAASAALLEDSVNQQVSGGNQDFFLNCVNWLCGRAESISIHAKSVSYEYLTIDSGAAGTMIVIMTGIIPLACLGAGIYTWIRRKRR